MHGIITLLQKSQLSHYLQKEVHIHSLKGLGMKVYIDWMVLKVVKRALELMQMKRLA